MVAYLQAVPLAPLRAIDHRLYPVSAVDRCEDAVIQDLYTQLHAGGPQGHGPLYLGVVEDVGTGLHGQTHAPVLRFRVPCLRGLQIGCVAAVHGIEAPPHEPILVFGLPAREGPAHYDEIYLICPVADLRQLPYPVGYLHIRIELVPCRTSGRRLLSGIGLRGIVLHPARTVRALAVGTGMGGRHHRYHGHPAHGAYGFLHQEGFHELSLGVVQIG